MAFRDSFHEVIPGYRINGEVMVFAVKSIKDGGLGDGRKLLQIGNFGCPNKMLMQVTADETAPSGYVGVEDVDAIYETLELAGMSTVVEGVLVNPNSVALLEYSDDEMVAHAAGDGGIFIFERANVSTWQTEGNVYKVPDALFNDFKTLALQRLTTALQVVGQISNAYIHFDGSNDYVQFTGKGAGNVGLLDWDQDWTIGMTLTEFDVNSDGKFITLFKSGSNAIMLRRGGSNHGLYVTGNDGATKIGANTWYAPNAGGKILFAYDGTANKRLKYYIGNVDGTFSLRANYLVNTANIGGNTVGTDFCVGLRVGSNAVAESLMFHGGANNLIVADEALAGPLVTEYFQVSETYNEASFYADLTSWVKMGEDTYPNVVDVKGALTGGELIDGTEEDFVEISE
jgi:hypothetical protein